MLERIAEAKARLEESETALATARGALQKAHAGLRTSERHLCALTLAWVVTTIGMVAFAVRFGHACPAPETTIRLYERPDAPTASIASAAVRALVASARRERCSLLLDPRSACP